MISLGFLVFSVPLISGSLGLTQTTSIDARVKTDVMHRDYCGLAVKEYITYLLADTTRWDTFLADNLDPLDTTQVTASLDLCGQDITLTVTQQAIDPLEDAISDVEPTIPEGPAYNQRDFQTYKIVSNPNPSGGATVTYTITVINRSADPTTLTDIRDTLPTGFTYKCNNPDQLTLPGEDAVNIEPSNGGGCPTGTSVDWSMPSGTTIDPGDEVVIEFNVDTINNPGTYCNEIQVVPGADKTSSGQTAIVEIDTTGGQCPGEAVLITQTMDFATLTASDLTTIPYTYTLRMGYTITVDNIGSEDLDLTLFEDLLPVGFTYFATDPLGSITDTPFKLNYVPTLDRQEVTWKFNPAISIAPGNKETLIFTADAVSGQGVYWVDLLTSFGVGAFSEKVYSWPTAALHQKSD